MQLKPFKKTVVFASNHQSGYILTIPSPIVHGRSGRKQKQGPSKIVSLFYSKRKSNAYFLLHDILTNLKILKQTTNNNNNYE